MMQDLLQFSKIAKLTKKYKRAESDAIQRKEWAMINKDTKAVLREDSFWTRLAKLLHTWRGGLTVSHLDLSASEEATSFQHYLPLVRSLSQDLLSWTPKGVDTRDADGRRMYLFFVSPSLSSWSVFVHYFTVHYTDRLRRHDNLQCMCSEGGEHLHQPNARLVERRRSEPSWKCLVVLVVIAHWGARSLELWAARVLVASLWSSPGPEPATFWTSKGAMEK